MVTTGSAVAPSAVYRTERGRAAIATEIYLPQKYALNPDVVTALRDLMKRDKILAHFKAKKPSDFAHVLVDHMREKNKFQRILGRLGDPGRDPSFGGYTIRSVLGGFKGQPQIEYDSNAVIELLSWPKPPHKEPFLDRAFVERVIRTVFGLRRHNENRPSFTTLAVRSTRNCSKRHEHLSRLEQSKARRIQEWLEDWMEDETMLLHGFVLHKLVEVTECKEQVIMMTSCFKVVHLVSREPDLPC